MTIPAAPTPIHLPRFGSHLGAYAAWRETLAASVRALRAWLVDQALHDPQTDHRFDRLLDRLGQDTLRIAFVAEFSRGKSELINAIFFSDFGCRVLPSTAGRTTMCPTEILYQPGLPPSIRLLPIDTRRLPQTLADWRSEPEKWTTLPIDVESAESMARAISHVSETVRVTVAEASELGLHNPEHPGAATVIPIDGKIEIPRWRHAVINFRHPLLEQGLVILDTPGLNAIGTEPELTLNLLPDAHAIVFILAADTGVTATDAAIWRDHVATGGPSPRGRLVALNKIDSMWDELKTTSAIESELARQVASTADLLGIPESQVFPVSAQKALVARVAGDRGLLMRSRLPAFEEALARGLIPIKHTLVAEACLADLREATVGLSAVLDTRAASASAQLSELLSLRDKNENVMTTMAARAIAEKEQFDAALRRYFAVRNVFTRQGADLLERVGVGTLRNEARLTRGLMDRAKFTVGLRAAMSAFFDNLRARLSAAEECALETHTMMGTVHDHYARDYGIEALLPEPFPIAKYIRELDRLERAYNVHFNTLWNMASNIKDALMRKFFETVAARMKHIYEVASDDAGNWIKSMRTPLENQMRERQRQVARRLESVERIREARTGLELRVNELAETKALLQSQTSDFTRLMARVEAAARAVPRTVRVRDAA